MVGTHSTENIRSRLSPDCSTVDTSLFYAPAVFVVSGMLQTTTPTLLYLPPLSVLRDMKDPSVRLLTLELEDQSSRDVQRQFQTSSDRLSLGLGIELGLCRAVRLSNIDADAHAFHAI